jgi:hypothetical protein
MTPRLPSGNETAYPVRKLLTVKSETARLYLTPGIIYLNILGEFFVFSALCDGSNMMHRTVHGIASTL